MTERFIRHFFGLLVFLSFGVSAATPDLPKSFNPETCFSDAKKPENRNSVYSSYPCEALSAVYRWQPVRDSILDAANAVPHPGSNMGEAAQVDRLKKALATLSSSAHRLETDFKRPPQEPRDLIGDYLIWSQKLFAERGWPVPRSLSGIFDEMSKRVAKPYVDPAEQQAVLLVASERGGALVNLATEVATVAMNDQVGFAQDRQIAERKKAEAAELAAKDSYIANVQHRAKAFRGF